MMQRIPAPRAACINVTLLQACPVILITGHVIQDMLTQRCTQRCLCEVQRQA